ncbi:MAG: ABC transporter permease [Gemmatimonadales bacterium]|jgi:putative ABC transport system permease protein
MDSLVQDLRYAGRALLKSPTHSTLAVLTLALGIGISVAIFSVVDNVLLRPLPFADSRRLVAICETHPSVAGFCIGSPPDVEDFAARSRTLSSIGLGRDWPFTARHGAASEGVNGGLATPGLFRTLQIAPALGRFFHSEDMGPGAARVTVLSDALWRSWYGADPAVIGRSLVLDGQSYQIVGVMRPGDEAPQLEEARLWVPLPFNPKDEENRRWRGFQVIGRLAAGATPASAAAELGAIQRDLGLRYPQTNRDWGVRVEPLLDQMVGPVRPTLLVFLGAVAILLLVATANVANLLVARGASREREFALRSALGAGPGRLFRLIAAESLVMALVGGAAGLLVARWAMDILLPLIPGGVPRLGSVALDARVLGFALLLTAASGVVAGLAPAARAARLDLAAAIKEGHQPMAWRRALGLRGGLVIAEVAMAFVLATGAGLLARSFASLLRWQPGFDQTHLLTFWTLASDGKYRDHPSVTAVFERIGAELKTIPGVTSVGTASSGPLFGGTETDEFVLEGSEAAAGREPVVARWYDMDPGYFPTLGVALKRGRLFTDADREGAPYVAIINEAMARRYFNGVDPVGRRLRSKNATMPMEIVGVVADIPPFLPGTPAQPEVYWPYAQSPRWASFFVLRTSGDPSALAKVAEARLKSVDPDMEASGIATLEDRVGRQLRRPRFNLLLIGVFAACALGLTIVGVYGVIAASVAGRTREIGVRVALGATAGQVLEMVVREGMVLVGLGVSIGLVAAIWLTRFAARMLYGVTPGDVWTRVVVVALVAIAALVACLVPARRATKVDPLVALRSE